MHYVIFRDDDTNAFTPVECLDLLYRPFLERGWPVNLASIPEVSTTACTAEGNLEAFLTVGSPGGWGDHEPSQAIPNATGTLRRTGPAMAPVAPPLALRDPVRAIGSNVELVNYLHENPGFRIIQHGLHHSFQEFAAGSSATIDAKLERGTQLLLEAGFPPPSAFVAPQDRFSPAALQATARRFNVISTGWFEWKRLPGAWWPRYALKKLFRQAHWRVGRTLLLSHPGCLLSCYRDYSTIVEKVLRHVQGNRLTIVVTHWWEYFRDGRPDEKFIRVLHEVGRHLANAPDIRVISFHDLSAGIAIN